MVKSAWSKGRPVTVRGTPSWLGDQNARVALSLLLRHGPLSRSRISALSGLSQPTAVQIVNRLLDRGLIEPVGKESGARGRSGIVYGVRDDLLYGVAITVDQRGVRSRVVDPLYGEHPLAERSAAHIVGERSAGRDAAEAVLKACRMANVDVASVRHVCIGVPSSVDPRTDELSSVEALPGWSRDRIRTQLVDALDCEVMIDNDVNLAAVAERATGAVDESASIAVLWIGYGIGLALDLAGTIHRGSSGGAGEIGHLPASGGSWGGQGTEIEDVVGAAGLEALAEEIDHPFRFEDVLAGKKLPPRLLERLAPRLAPAVIPVLSVVDPDAVVFTGPVGRAGGPQLAALVTEAIRDHTRWIPSIQPSQVPDDPVISGAATLSTTRLRHLLNERVDTPSPDQVGAETSPGELP